MAKQYALWVVRYRWLVIVSTILLTALLAYGGQRLGFTNDYRVFFGEENPQLLAFENLQDTYTKNDNVLIMLEPKDGKVFTNDTLPAVVDLTERAWQVPYSTRVDSISNFQYTYAEEDDLIVEDLIEEAGSLSAEELQKIQSIAVKEPRLVNKLVSPGGHVTGVNITVESPGIDPAKELPEVVEYVRGMIGEFEAKYPHIGFYITGVVMMNQAFPEASIGDMQNLIPVALGIILVGLVLFLRSFTGTVITLIVILVSILMAMGTAGWLGIKLTPPSATAPTLILTLAVADCVHLLVTFLHGMRHGMNKEEAIRESLRVNLHPVFLTSVTTAIGFLSMNFSDSPPFHDLGNITAMGVMFAFVLSVYFLPAMVCVLPFRVKQRENDGHTRMEKLADLVINYRKQFFIGMGLAIVTLVAMVPRNELNDVFVEYFDTSVPFRSHTDHITANLSGMYFVDYSLDTGSSSAINEPQYLNQIEAFANWFRQQPEVVHVNVISETFKKLNQNMHADDRTYYRVPDDRELAAQYLLLYEMSLPYGLDLNNQINIDKSATRLQVTLKTLSTRQTLGLEQRAQEWLKSNAPKLLTDGSSPTVMFSHIAKRNINSMLLGTTLALVLISMLLIFALKSWKYGLLSLIPNLLPAGMGFGLWALLVGQVGLAVSVVAAMTLGIVVDDTIHFLSKYLRAKREKGLDTRGAIRYAFSTVGVALFVTTVVLVGGFMVLAQSVFQVNSSMGLLTAITISLALIVDFFFLPPLLMFAEEKTA